MISLFHRYHLKELGLWAVYARTFRFTSNHIGYLNDISLDGYHLASIQTPLISWFSLTFASDYHNQSFFSGVR
jgi:hypothetical protein